MRGWLSAGAWWRLPRDTNRSSAMAFLFSVALGVSSLLLPLIAAAGGYSAVDVGLLYSASAVTQIFARIGMGRVLRVLPDRTAVAISAVALIASFLVVFISPHAVAVLAAAWILQGISRAFFWTGSQTHVVRGPGTPVAGMATLNFFTSVGLLIGPIIAGLLVDVSAEVALLIGIGFAAVALWPIFGMDLYPPFARRAARRPRGIWRQPGVDAACGAGAVAGAWRGLLDSMIPVILQQARQSSATIGVLVGVANAASVVGSVVIGGVRPAWTRTVYTAGLVTAAVGMASLGFFAGSALLVAVVMGLAGLGTGALQTLAPAVAATSVAPGDQGDAIAVTGVARTVALSGTPFVVTGILAVAPVAVAMLAVGVACAAPIWAARSLTHRPGGHGTS